MNLCWNIGSESVYYHHFLCHLQRTDKTSLNRMRATQVLFASLLSLFISQAHNSTFTHHQDLWNSILPFMDWDGFQKIHGISRGHRALISYCINQTDKAFLRLENLIQHLSESNYDETQILLDINELMQHQTELIRMKLASNPHVTIKLLLPQIENKHIITQNLKLTMNLSKSNDLALHFYQNFISFAFNYAHGDNETSIKNFGRLFALKYLDEQLGYKHFEISDASWNKIVYLMEPVLHHTVLFISSFDDGAFDILFNPFFYSGTCKMVARQIQKYVLSYWALSDPVHLWSEHSSLNVFIWRKVQRSLWIIMFEEHVKHFCNQHPVFLTNRNWFHILLLVTRMKGNLGWRDHKFHKSSIICEN